MSTVAKLENAEKQRGETIWSTTAPQDQVQYSQSIPCLSNIYADLLFP